MSRLSILFMVIRYVPEFISLVEALITLFRKSPEQFSQSDFSEVKSALKQVYVSGDKTGLKDVLEGLHGRMGQV